MGNVPLSTRDAQVVLADLIGELSAALDAETFDPTVAERAGATFVGMRLSNPKVIARSANLFAGLDRKVQSLIPEGVSSRSTALFGSFGHGYAAALRSSILADQHALHHAMSVARRQTQDALRLSDTRFRAVFEHAAVAIAIADTSGVLIDVNPALSTILATRPEKLRGTKLSDHLHPDDRSRFDDVCAELVAACEGTVRIETRFLRKDKADGWALFAITLIKGVDGHEDYVLASGEDVTERRAMQAALYDQARHDPLTGLPNRLLLREALDAAISTAAPTDRIGLCFLDLDGFKTINDRYGHGAGDRLLAAVASRLGIQAAENGYIVARLGGDEFIALIPVPAEPATVLAAAQGMIAVLDEPFEVEGHSTTVSVSIGVLVPSVAGADPDTLLDSADAALYRAKADGGGVLFIHDPGNL